MDIFKIVAPHLVTFVLIMTRFGALFLLTPFFGSTIFPAKVKIFFGAAMSLAVFHLVEPVTNMPEHPLGYFSLFAYELIIGLVIGYACLVVFQGIQMGGQLIGHQMMFQMVNVLDPESNVQITIIGQIEFLVALLLFLALNVHHLLLKAMVDSLELIPLGTVQVSLGPMLQQFDHLFGRLFLIAFQVAAPAAGILFLTRFTMGLIARVMPQMNVFIVGMPLYVGVGLLTTGLSLGVSYVLFERYFIEMIDTTYVMLRLLG